jgi:hypothetical protein
VPKPLLQEGILTPTPSASRGKPIQGPERPQEDPSRYFLTGEQAVGALKQVLQVKEPWIREQAISGVR